MKPREELAHDYHCALLANPMVIERWGVESLAATALSAADAFLAACPPEPAAEPQGAAPTGGVRWREIATAPRDGTAVLVMSDDWPGTESGRADECCGHNTYVAEWWGNEAEGGMWVCYMGMSEEPRCPVTPTHWMPLPLPPRIVPVSEQARDAEADRWVEQLGLDQADEYNEDDDDWKTLSLGEARELATLIERLAGRGMR